LRLTGEWLQSPPLDLSRTDIHWYTWGFSGISYFAGNVERVTGDHALLTINAQACDATRCALVDELTLLVPFTDATSESALPSVDLASLVPSSASPTQD
jgi:hypothetical protein